MTINGNTTSGSVTALSSTGGLVVGMRVVGIGIPMSATVATILSSNSMTISAAAAATNTGTWITFGNANTFSHNDENRLINYQTGESGTETYAYDHRTRRSNNCARYQLGLLAG